MDWKEIKAVYHVDVDPDLYIEIHLNAERNKVEERAKYEEEGFGKEWLLCEFWIVKQNQDPYLESEDKYMWERCFSLATKAEGILGIFDENFYQMTKLYRRSGLPGLETYYEKNMPAPTEYRWLYYQKEAAAVLPVLRMLGLATLRMEILSKTKGEKLHRFEYAVNNREDNDVIAIDGELHTADLQNGSFWDIIHRLEQMTG